MTSGTFTWSLYIQENLEVWLMTWSAIKVTKSPNMISTTGFNPRMAIPVATPTMPASDIGVLNTRSGNELERPRVTLNAPP
jgi:hypothetical protein